MKRLLTLGVAVMTTVSLTATTIGHEAAKMKAGQLLGKPVAEVIDTKAGSRSTSGNVVADDAYYLFNANDGKGFVIVAAEDELGEVLGYSHSGCLPAADQLPDALKLFLASFSELTSDYRQGMAVQSASVPARHAPVVDPLVKTMWDQGAPYNNLCPLDNNKHCVTGCTATALAQVMKYWEWPEKGSGYGSATVANSQVTGTLEHTYNWGLMLNTTAELLASEEAAAAVAELMYDCGLALGVSYGASTSGGTPIRMLYSNFGYIPTTLRTLRRDCYDTDREWLDVLFKEIDNGRPVYYTARSQTYGGADSNGHAFVIDGYDSSSLLHVNWGWGGFADGYYDVARMNPSSYTFIIDQAAIIGIEPAKNGETGVPEEYPYMSMKPTCDRSGTINKSVDFNITIGGIWNHTGNSHNWTVSIGIYDIYGKMLGDAKKRGGGVQALNLQSNQGYSGVYGDVTCSLSSKTLADGHYVLRVIFKENKDWILPDVAGGQKNNAIYFDMSNKKITFTDGAAYIEAYETAGMAPVITSQPTDENNTLYDLQGRKVDTPRKGIYIKNGHKVVY